MRKDFYKDLDVVRKAKAKRRIEGCDVEQLLSLIATDQELSWYFYDNNKESAWLQVLREHNAFSAPPNEDYWPQAKYLKNIAGKEPEEVSEIIREIKTNNQYVLRDLLQALITISEKDPEAAFKAADNVLVACKSDEIVSWFFLDRELMEFISRISIISIDKAIEIATAFLEIKPQVRDDKKSIHWYNTQAKLNEYEYSEIVANEYKRLIEKDPYKAGIALVNLLTTYFNGWRKLNPVKDNYDYTEHTHYYYAALEEALNKKGDVISALLAAIYGAGKLLRKKPSSSLYNEYLQELRSRNVQLLERTYLVLLKDSSSRKLLKEAVNNEKYYDHCFWAEFKHVLESSSGVLLIDDFIKYINWVKDFSYSIERFRDATGPDTAEEEKRKYENHFKAKRLFPIKDIESARGLYDSYSIEGEFKPENYEEPPIKITFMWGDTPEYSSIKEEEIEDTPAQEVIDLFLAKQDSISSNSEDHSNPFKATSNILQAEVNKRPDEFLELKHEQLAKLKSPFLEALLWGIYERLRTGEYNIKSWDNLFALAQQLFMYYQNQEYFECARRILRIIDETVKNQLAHFAKNDNLIKALKICSKFIRSPAFDELEYVHKYDPYTRCINTVRGIAFETAVILGPRCKAHHKPFYTDVFREKLYDIINYMRESAREPHLFSIFGVHLGNIYWLDGGEWIKSHVNEIFDMSDVDLWEATWGSYLSWGIVAKPLFDMFKENGHYAFAIDKMDQEKKYDHRKDLGEALVDHLMIAYWNGWIELDDGLFRAFWKKSEPELREYAASFMETGFVTLQAKTNDEKSRRITAYWKYRLAEMEKNKRAARKEARGFLDWVEHPTFSEKEVLELLSKTLEFSGGDFKRGTDFGDLVNAICKIADADTKTAIQCLNRIFIRNNQYEARVSYDSYSDNLNTIFEKIFKLKKPLKEEAIKLVNNVGRHAVIEDTKHDKYLHIYNKLTQ